MSKEINHAERDHALLSASGAKRWLACTPSARLEEFFPEVTSAYAEEGTKAHETAEKILTALIEGRKRPAFRNNEIKEIAKNIQPYIDYVWNIYTELNNRFGGAVIFLETRVDFSDYIPEGFGTGDVIILNDSTLHIIDLKYGKGVPVSAKENEQLRLYALGAIKMYEDIYDIDRVVMHIAQPRLDSYSHEQLPRDELEAWGEIIVKPKAIEAFNGTGAFIDGDHCQFCKAAAVCRHRLEKYTAITRLQNMKPEELASNGELATVLREASMIEKWLRQVKTYAIEQMKAGVKFEGLKLVAGRSTTVLKDQDKLIQILKDEGIDDALIYKPKELVSMTELKSIVGKKRFEELTADIYEKVAGNPTLDKAESKKEEWKPGGDFGEVDVSKYE